MITKIKPVIDLSESTEYICSFEYSPKPFIVSRKFYLDLSFNKFIYNDNLKTIKMRIVARYLCYN